MLVTYNVPVSDERHADCALHTAAAMQRTVQQRTANPELASVDLSFSPLSDAPPMFAFLETLMDPCTLDRACLAPWIPDPSEAPDENQLNAVDMNGNPL